MSLRNKKDFREAVLQALDVTDDKDVENEYNFKSAVLEAMGVEFVPADLRDFEIYRAKLVEGIGNMSYGDGGDFWSLALPDTGYKINAFSDTYEGQDQGHGEYIYRIVRELAPEEVWDALNGAFTAPFEIKINGNSYSVPYLDLFNGQITPIDGGIFIQIQLVFPEEGEEVPYGITLQTNVATAEINCPDITIVEPSNDVIELMQLLHTN